MGNVLWETRDFAKQLKKIKRGNKRAYGKITDELSVLENSLSKHIRLDSGTWGDRNVGKVELNGSPTYRLLYELETCSHCGISPIYGSQCATQDLCNIKIVLGFIGTHAEYDEVIKAAPKFPPRKEFFLHSENSEAEVDNNEAPDAEAFEEIDNKSSVEETDNLDKEV